MARSAEQSSSSNALYVSLAWLAKAQSNDGRWDVDGFKRARQCGGAGDRSDGELLLQ